MTSIDWQHLYLEGKETDLIAGDVKESELFPVEEFGGFRIRLINGAGMGEIINFAEWVKRNRMDG